MSNNTSVLDNTFDAIGLIGGFVFPICNIPQIIQIIKTKSILFFSLSAPMLYV